MKMRLKDGKTKVLTLSYDDGVVQDIRLVEIMDKYGIKIDDNIVENIIRNGTANIDAEYLKCITDTAVKYVADIFNALNRYEYNPKLMHLYIIGGGGCLIKNFGIYEKDKVTIIDDICAAAKGYEYLALATLRKRG